MASYSAVRVAIYDAIRENKHERIRELLEQNPDVAWSDTFEFSFCRVCDCGTSELRLSNALFGDKVTIETCRLLFDLGFIGPTNCGFLLTCWFGSRAVRNVFEMCEWYTPKQLAQLRSESDDPDGIDTLIQASLRSSVGAAHRQLRPRYVQWLNMLLHAGCPMSSKDEFRLALMDIHVDEATRTVHDGMPELQTDVALFRKWHRRYCGPLRPLRHSEGDAPMAQRLARLRETIASLPLEDFETARGYSDTDDDDSCANLSVSG